MNSLGFKNVLQYVHTYPHAVEHMQKEEESSQQWVYVQGIEHFMRSIQEDKEITTKLSAQQHKIV